MAYNATVYKVFIASPSDAASERSIIREVLIGWNITNSDTRKIVLLPVGWETDASPPMGDRPQSIMNTKILRDCDLLVGVFWVRRGTAHAEYMSSLVEVIEEHIKVGKPVMLYFSSAPVHPDAVDPGQYLEFQKFKESCESRGIFVSYDDLNDLKTKFYRHLNLKMSRDQYFKKGVPLSDDVGHPAELTMSDIPALSREAQELLKEANQDPIGKILRKISMGGVSIRTNGREFVEDMSARTRATWEGAIKELEDEGLLADRGNKKEAFGLTRKGHEVAERVVVEPDQTKSLK